MENKMQNEKLKKTPRFGVLDFLIILLVIAIVVGVYFRSYIVNWITDQRNIQEYTVTFSLDDIRYTTPDYIAVGDAVYFEDGTLFGTLMVESDDGSVMPLGPTAASKTFTVNGEVVELRYPNLESRVDAKGRLSVEGRYSEEGGFLVNGAQYIAAGQTIFVRTELVSLQLRIVSIDPVSAE